LYVLLFFLTTQKGGVGFEQAADASWKVTYVLLPIVTAFGTYWFGTQQAGQQGHPPDDQAVLDMPRTIALFSITAVVNMIVLLFVLFGIVFYDFNNPDSKASYSERVDMSIRILVLLASLVALPVGYLLGRPVPRLEGPIPPFHGGDPPEGGRAE